MQLTPNSHLVNITKTTADITINSDFTAANSSKAANEPLLVQKNYSPSLIVKFRNFNCYLQNYF